MESFELKAISPIDGRYRNKVAALENYFSEYALIRYRVLVEIEYFIALCELPLPQLQHFNQELFAALRHIYESFSIDDAIEIKEIEKTTNHDVKAVEYFLKKKFDILDLHDFKEFIHFGLTSQDINNVAIPLLMKAAHEQSIEPAFQSLVFEIRSLAIKWKDIPMLARTHGQAASPTRLGKKLYVFVERMEKQLNALNSLAFEAKFGGATGNFNA
ncbi:MAG: lyase family protein, partial [Ignavibacteria bacterium]|nr:lyase family protein [Ignavibacteria bacterium]